MHGNELGVSHCFPYSSCHITDDGQIFVISRVSISSEYPDNAFALIAFSKELAIDISVFRGKDFRAYAPSFIKFIAPSGQQADEHAQLVGLVHNIINMLEISFVWTAWVIVVQRSVSEGIGNLQS